MRKSQTANGLAFYQNIEKVAANSRLLIDFLGKKEYSVGEWRDEDEKSNSDLY